MTTKIRHGALVIVHRGPYKDPRRVRVYSVEKNRLRNLVYITLPSGCGVSTPRSNVRLAADQTETKAMLTKRLRNEIASAPAIGVPIARVALLRKQLNAVTGEVMPRLVVC
jgi:hypothetical protein